MNRRRQIGLTLAEAVVAGTLAVVLGLLMLKLLTSGLGAHAKGAESRDAQSGVRNLVSLMVSELRSSAPPPLAEPLVITPVFWPGVWGADQELSSGDDFYPRKQEATTDGKGESDWTGNRLVYVRTKEGAPNPNGGPLDPYVLVELFVPQDKPWLVERRITALSGLTSALKKGQVKGADGNTHEAWLLDLSGLPVPAPGTEPDVLFDAGPEARVAFKVSHLTFEPISDPGRTRYPELFEPGVFRLDVAVAIRAKNDAGPKKAWPEAGDWSTMREESTEIRIPSVRQS